MRYQGTPATITTLRLTLRPFLITDASAMFTNWASDARVSQFLRFTPHKNLEESQQVIDRWVAGYTLPEPQYLWAIVRNDDNTVMGSIGVTPSEHDETILEPGYCIGYDYWGKGYMTEALQAVLQYMFMNEQVALLHCCHAVQNPASGNVLKKCGFIYTHDDVYHKFDGTPVDCHCYRQTKTMYLQNNQTNFATT